MGAGAAEGGKVKRSHICRFARQEEEDLVGTACRKRWMYFEIVVHVSASEGQELASLAVSSSSL